MVYGPCNPVRPRLPSNFGTAAVLCGDTAAPERRAAAYGRWRYLWTLILNIQRQAARVQIHWNLEFARYLQRIFARSDFLRAGAARTLEQFEESARVFALDTNGRFLRR